MAENLDIKSEPFGPNDWLVEEMYSQYLENPQSVSGEWREFFQERSVEETKGAAASVDPQAPVVPQKVVRQEVGSWRPMASGSNRQVATSGAPMPQEPPAAPTVAAPAAPSQNAPVAPPAVAPASQPQPVAPSITEQTSTKAQEANTLGKPEVKAIRGAALRVVQNMVASLSVPTATSVRSVPAKLLEVNRLIVNNQQIRVGAGKVSFTHFISYAVIKAIAAVPQMNRSFDPDIDKNGTPGVVINPQVNLGVAVDVEKSDGSRSLFVAVVKDCQGKDFRQFVEAYDAVVDRVRSGKMTIDDIVGATITVTNPGTLGTEHSIPRLMAGQGTIVGVGSLGFPVEYSAADPKLLARLGISKSVTLTSTYDHRIIQGAESGVFLKKIHSLLIGEDRFYDEIFESLGIPYVPARWLQDENPSVSADGESQSVAKQVNVHTLINNYRVRGHLMAVLDPLGIHKISMPSELDPATYHLSVWDLEREFYVDGLAGKERMKLGDILGVLRDAYCRSIGVEYMHIQEPEEKRWIQSQFEGVKADLDLDEMNYLLDRLNRAEAFERFLHTRYIGQKRFGLEGAESAIAFIDEVLCQAAASGISDSVIGMAHRGRLNVLANIVGKSYREIFKEFEGNLDPNSVQGSGDVKYHKGYVGNFVARSGEEIGVVLSANPSHLEAVDPVVEGITRAKQDLYRNPGEFPVLAILVHGDAAFAGQGVVTETLNMSQLRGYRTGGTIHLVINNQVGFTTDPSESRSSVYATDVAKMVQAPIFHVNGDDPEAVVRVAKVAFAYRQRFHKDAVIDMVCYRRFGHNEGDEPSYTQPKMYEIIDKKPSVRKIYTETLVRRHDMTPAEAEKALEGFLDILQNALDETRSAAAPNPTILPPAPQPNVALEVVETKADRASIEFLSGVLHSSPDDFVVHPKLERQLKARAQLFKAGEVDWALGEALCFGEILLDGRDIRFSGQDSRRGTFSHRHAAMIDYETGESFVPLAGLAGYDGEFLRGEKPGRFMIYDSLLSEYAALGFEYGYSLIQNEALVIWEAQFGDFANGAQIIIDQFLAAASDKWGQRSGVVLLLPHGYEGQGPEHSSARIERFLTLAASDNLAIANVTTAAQYYHMLRAQVARVLKRPLIVFTPKSLLRAKQSRSPIEDLTNGHFFEVLDDPATTKETTVAKGDVNRIILCSGKVAYDAMSRRDQLLAKGGSNAVSAVVRIEQLYPWPDDQLEAVLNSYSGIKEVVWLQEEPENMGPWNFVHHQLHRILREKVALRHVSRVPSGSPATGSAAMHALELEDLMQRAVDQAI